MCSQEVVGPLLIGGETSTGSRTIVEECPGIRAQHVDEPLEAFLRSARHRIWTTDIARGALHGLAAASVAFLLCEILRAALAHLGFVGLPGSGARLISAAVAVALLVAWIGAATWRATFFAPDLLGMARLVDRRLELHERLSTALEVDAASPGNSLDALLGAAVVDDARARVRTIAPGALTQPRLPGRTVLVPIVLVLALLVPQGDAMLRQGVPAGPAAPSQPVGPEKAVAAESSQQVTELHDVDAGKKPLSLSGIATSADARGTGASGGTPLRQDVTPASGRLEASTADADGAAPSSQQQRDAAQASPRDVVALQSPPQQHPTLNGARPSQQEPGSPSRQAAQQQQQRPPQPNVNNPEQAPVAIKNAPAAHAGDGYDEAFSTFRQPQPASANAQMTLTEQKQVEAAENAYSNGREAGDGTRPLGNGGDDGQLADMLSRDTGQLSLPRAMGTAGERISVKVAPLTETGPAISYSANRSDTWTESPDQAVSRRQPHAWEREILARYFRPDPDSQ